jgi:anti-sigma B factor antagonist
VDKPRIVVTQDDSGVWLIELLGEHDVSTVPDLRLALDEVFSHGTRILIDLSETTFIDSTVMGALVEAQRRCDEHADEKLIVAAPPGGQPAAVCSLVHLHDVLCIADSREAALRDL